MIMGASYTEVVDRDRRIDRQRYAVLDEEVGFGFEPDEEEIKYQVEETPATEERWDILAIYTPKKTALELDVLAELTKEENMLKSAEIISVDKAGDIIITPYNADEIVEKCDEVLAAIEGLEEEQREEFWWIKDQPKIANISDKVLTEINDYERERILELVKRPDRPYHTLQEQRQKLEEVKEHEYKRLEDLAIRDYFRKLIMQDKDILYLEAPKREVV